MQGLMWMHTYTNRPKLLLLCPTVLLILAAQTTVNCKIKRSSLTPLICMHTDVNNTGHTHHGTCRDSATALYHHQS